MNEKSPKNEWLGFGSLPIVNTTQGSPGDVETQSGQMMKIAKNEWLATEDRDDAKLEVRVGSSSPDVSFF